MFKVWMRFKIGGCLRSYICIYACIRPPYISFLILLGVLGPLRSFGVLALLGVCLSATGVLGAFITFAFCTDLEERDLEEALGSSSAAATGVLGEKTLGEAPPDFTGVLFFGEANRNAFEAALLLEGMPSAPRIEVRR